MKNEKQLIPKLNKIFFAFIFLLIILCARLIHLQIILSKKLYNQGQRNFLRINKITPTRGNIIDINGKLLATNKPIHNLYFDTDGKKDLTTIDINNLKTIEQIIEKTLTDEETIKKIKIACKYNQKFLLKPEITFDQLSKIEEQFGTDSFISIETAFKRFYPQQSHACHILGYLGRMDIDNMGKMGLEKLLEESLKGKDGTVSVKINSFGIKLSETIVENSLSGKDIKINLDLDIQEIIEKAFPQNLSGSFILMDPQNGAIVALLSRPNFDPNIFLSPISKPEWDQLQENNPFLNRAFGAVYPPGSIFKPVTMSMALDKGIINENETCHCCGYITFAGRKYYCHNHDGHGTLNAEQALEQSCNIMFFNIAKKMNIDTLADYAERYGLGQKTNIIFPEKLGIVPSKKWKKQNVRERWYKGENLSAAIGQSYLSITPIQAARMVSSIFTGYLVNPRILEQEPIITEPLKITQKTLNFLRRSMRKVVMQGTARSINRKDFEIYAKTGTAQTSDLSKRDLGGIYCEHKWFVGNFKYKENKPLTFVVMVENAEPPTAAKEAVIYMLGEYKKLIDKREDKVEKEVLPTSSQSKYINE